MSETETETDPVSTTVPSVTQATTTGTHSGDSSSRTVSPTSNATTQASSITITSATSATTATSSQSTETLNTGSGSTVAETTQSDSLPDEHSTTGDMSSTSTTTGMQTVTESNTSGPLEGTAPPCGAKYSAIGDGGWLLCVRLADGGGACSDKGTETFHRVAFEDGTAITNVAQVSGFGDTSVGVVTTDGALYTGVGPTGIQKTPVIAEGVVNFSGGYHSRVALTKKSGEFGIVGWVDTGDPTAITLPSGVSPIQVSGNYGLACALTATGDVYCWDAGGNHNVPNVTSSPSKVALDGPVTQVSVGQNTVCGVTTDNKLTCVAAWYDNPWLPSEGQAPDFTVRQSTFPEVREVHAGFHQGIIIDQTGVAYFLEGNGSPGQDNPGMPFAGVSDVIAAGGDRGNACVQTGAGDLYCWVGGATRATLDGTPVKVAAADCPL
jgi:hypothetical protein